MISLAPADLWSMFKRRFLIMVVIGSIGVAAALVYALSKPAIYETSAKILVEAQQIPNDLARSTVNSSAAERLQLIEQRLMSRDNLIAVIEKLNVFADNPNMPLLAKIGAVRGATRIRSIGVSGGRGRGISAFTITVRLSDPVQAAAIANEFVNIVLEQNLRARAERARETLAFFEREERRIGDDITALEVEIAGFKETNEHALPESRQFRRAELANIQQHNLEIEREILGLEDQRAALVLALDSDRPAIAANETRPQSPEEDQLRKLRRELAVRRSVLAPNHPEIKRLEGEIESLIPLVPGESVHQLGSSPEDQREAAEQQIARWTSRIQLLQDQQAQFDRQRAALEASLLETPQVEMALNAYERRHQQLQDQYSVITRKRAEAETGEKLEVNQQSERFEVVENAIVPQGPVEPNRKKILVLGSGVSMAIAGGLALLLEILNPVIRSTAQMERQLNLRPVISIPHVRTPFERRRRRALIVGGVVGLCAAVTFGMDYVDQNVMPLDTVAETIADRTGINTIIRVVEERLGLDKIPGTDAALGG